MAATVTLSTTTLDASVSASDHSVLVASTSGITPGLRLWIDKELMAVVSFGVGNNVNVLRGVDGTATAAHSSGATVTIGRADQFYDTDPVGRPELAIPVSPYINTSNGKVWFAQGDETNSGDRWWQEQTTTYSYGALGVRITTTTP